MELCPVVKEPIDNVCKGEEKGSPTEEKEGDRGNHVCHIWNGLIWFFTASWVRKQQLEASYWLAHGKPQCTMGV